MGESILPRSWPKPRRSPAGPTKGGTYLIVGVLLVLLGAALGWSRSGIAISLGAILSAIGALAVFIGCIAIGVRIGITDARGEPDAATITTSTTK